MSAPRFQDINNTESSELQNIRYKVSAAVNKAILKYLEEIPNQAPDTYKEELSKFNIKVNNTILKFYNPEEDVVPFVNLSYPLFEIEQIINSLLLACQNMSTFGLFDNPCQWFIDEFNELKEIVLIERAWFGKEYTCTFTESIKKLEPEPIKEPEPDSLDLLISKEEILTLLQPELTQDQSPLKNTTTPLPPNQETHQEQSSTEEANPLSLSRTDTKGARRKAKVDMAKFKKREKTKETRYKSTPTNQSNPKKMRKKEANIINLEADTENDINTLKIDSPIDNPDDHSQDSMPELIDPEASPTLPSIPSAPLIIVNHTCSTRELYEEYVIKWNQHEGFYKEKFAHFKDLMSNNFLDPVNRDLSVQNLINLFKEIQQSFAEITEPLASIKEILEFLDKNKELSSESLETCKSKMETYERMVTGHFNTIDLNHLQTKIDETKNAIITMKKLIVTNINHMENFQKFNPEEFAQDSLPSDFNLISASPFVIKLFSQCRSAFINVIKQYQVEVNNLRGKKDFKELLHLTKSDPQFVLTDKILTKYNSILDAFVLQQSNFNQYTSHYQTEIKQINEKAKMDDQVKNNMLGSLKALEDPLHEYHLLFGNKDDVPYKVNEVYVLTKQHYDACKEQYDEIQGIYLNSFQNEIKSIRREINAYFDQSAIDIDVDETIPLPSPFDLHPQSHIDPVSVLEDKVSALATKYDQNLRSKLFTFMDSESLNYFKDRDTNQLSNSVATVELGEYYHLSQVANELCAFLNVIITNNGFNDNDKLCGSLEKAMSKYKKNLKSTEVEKKARACVKFKNKIYEIINAHPDATVDKPSTQQQIYLKQLKAKLHPSNLNKLLASRRGNKQTFKVLPSEQETFPPPAPSNNITLDIKRLSADLLGINPYQKFRKLHPTSFWEKYGGYISGTLAIVGGSLFIAGGVLIPALSFILLPIGVVSAGGGVAVIAANIEMSRDGRLLKEAFPTTHTKKVAQGPVISTESYTPKARPTTKTDLLTSPINKNKTTPSQKQEVKKNIPEVDLTLDFPSSDRSSGFGFPK